MSNTVRVKIKKLYESAVIPKYAKPGDAGMDLVAANIIEETPFQITYGTGIAMKIPEGFVGLISPRSSIRKYDLVLSNSIGVIDSGYVGEIQATFNKQNNFVPNGKKLDLYKVGDRIAQILIIPYPTVLFEETYELPQTERGEGGFGSTGS